MKAETLAGGFENPAIQSAHAFRNIMEAMARPGTLCNIEGAAPPAPAFQGCGQCAVDPLRHRYARLPCGRRPTIPMYVHGLPFTRAHP